MKELENKKEYEEFIKQDKYVIVFTSTHCPPCKRLKLMVLPELSDTLPIALINCDNDEFSDLIKEYSIMSTPLTVVRNKDKLEQIQGVYQKTKILELF